MPRRVAREAPHKGALLAGDTKTFLDYRPLLQFRCFHPRHVAAPGTRLDGRVAVGVHQKLVELLFQLCAKNAGDDFVLGEVGVTFWALDPDEPLRDLGFQVRDKTRLANSESAAVSVLDKGDVRTDLTFH